VPLSVDGNAFCHLIIELNAVTHAFDAHRVHRTCIGPARLLDVCPLYSHDYIYRYTAIQTTYKTDNNYFLSSDLTTKIEQCEWNRINDNYVFKID